MKMKFFVIAAAVAVIGCVCVACGVEPVSGGTDGSIIGQKDIGSGDQTVGQGTDSADGGGDTGVQSDALDASVAEAETTPKDAAVETVGPLCPPEGRPERTVELQVADGIECFTPEEVTSVKQLNGAKLEAKGEVCKNFGDKKNCIAEAKVMSNKYQPKKWSKPVSYDGYPVLVLSFPFNPEVLIEQIRTGPVAMKTLYETPIFPDGTQYKSEHDPNLKKLEVKGYTNGVLDDEMSFDIDD